MYYVYMIRNKIGKLYYGSTKDLKNRFAMHNKGLVRSTKGHTWTLIYYEAYLNESDAREREYHLKRHGQAIRHLKSRIKRSLTTEVSAG